MSSKLLASLKLAQLKHAAFLTGLPSAGTKADIIAVLKSSISTRTPTTTGSRIVSVDMGIRNLAYCVLDVPHPSPSHTNSTKPKPLRVLAWKRLDLLHPSTSPHTPPIPTTTQPQPPEPKSKPRAPAIPPSAFTPSHLSRTALSLSRTLLSHSPTTILIERQRFRSGGGPAIQEWTVRVNMLEAMLWACLATLREASSLGRNGVGARAGEFPAVFEVLPARVAGFWVGDPDLDLRLTAETFASPNPAARRIDAGPTAVPGSSSSGRMRVQKKDKVAVVRGWLDSHHNGNGNPNPEPNGNGHSNPDVPLAFSGEAARIAKAFTAPSSRSNSRGTTKEGLVEREGSEERMGKRDDLADCLLQAVAWTRWEENREILARLLRS
ncbi:hypothetical protein LTR29_017892 [Friedmanniomyces endolithicus]|nr:hypothetical protein LTR29_017892 [Friedmanniomyces endolithicus]